ncbi:MAG TPA: L,D-transpeptidase [Solirubrobacteraceae bacterium]|nr:L,D-transpeptidase [Solirubrobacteraceae bacterium]
MSNRARNPLALLATLALTGTLAGASIPATAPAAGATGKTTPTTGTPSPTTETGTTPTSPTSPTPPAKPSPRTKITQLPKPVVTDGTAPLRVRLSGTPAFNSPMPTLRPNVAGKWKAAGDYIAFTPTSTLQPCSSYTLTVWAGTDATGDRPLGHARTLHLQVVCPGTLALQQALGRLGYLPYTVHASHGLNSGHARESRAKAAHYAFNPPRGPLEPDIAGAPGLWYDHLDPTTRGALMVFQQTRSQSPTGVPSSATWASLLATETHGSRDPRPYTFVTVSESVPETLQVHQGSHVALSSPTNTGVPGATTEQGTFPIFSRFTATTMSGTNPDGSKYVDPGVPWVNYFNGGDAVHGFPRPSYGTPQSNGCVELPIGTAQQVFGMLSIGDLVIVSG